MSETPKKLDAAEVFEVTLNIVATPHESNDIESTKSLNEREACRETCGNPRERHIIVIAFIVLMATTFLELFVRDSTSGFEVYATSSFNAHAMIATAAVVYKITAIVSYPMIAKLSEFFGRSKGFGIALSIYTLGYVLSASCQNVATYISAELFFAIGKAGFRSFQQIFLADTSSLINRGLWTQLPDAVAVIPSLYVGSIIQDAFIDHSTWRWGYGMASIVLGCALLPLVAAMYFVDKRTESRTMRTQKIASREPEPLSFTKAWHFAFYQLDFVGMLLMGSGMALICLPISMTGTSSAFKWHEPKLIVMIVLGFVLFCAFLLWNFRYSKNPFVPKRFFSNPSILLGIVIIVLDTCEDASFGTYYRTILQVSAYTTVGEATRIAYSKLVCELIFLVLCGVCLKFVKRTKIFLFIGVPIVVLGHGLSVYFVNNNGGTSRKILLYLANVLIGSGRGIYQCALQVTVQAIAGCSGIPMSIAFVIGFNWVGSLIGSCVAGGIWNSYLLKKLESALPAADKPHARKIYKSIKVALSYSKGTETRDAIAKAYRQTEQIIGWAGLAMVAPTLIFIFFIRDIELTEHKDIYVNGEESSLDNENKDMQVSAPACDYDCCKLPARA